MVTGMCVCLYFVFFFYWQIISVESLSHFCVNDSLPLLRIEYKFWISKHNMKYKYSYF